jgi:hypothetical protein
MKRKRAWEEPGFRFFTPEMQAFLGGYVPQAARVHAAAAEVSQQKRVGGHASHEAQGGRVVTAGQPLFGGDR